MIHFKLLYIFYYQKLSILYIFSNFMFFISLIILIYDTIVIKKKIKQNNIDILKLLYRINSFWDSSSKLKITSQSNICFPGYMNFNILILTFPFLKTPFSTLHDEFEKRAMKRCFFIRFSLFSKC